jgi:hypothetical protein
MQVAEESSCLIKQVNKKILDYINRFEHKFDYTNLV